MNTTPTTEQKMRDEKVPQLETSQELQQYIQSLVDRQHNYGTCVYAMSMAAEAAYNFVASKLGVIGFQASAASLDFMRRARNIKGPFMLVDLDKELYEDGACVDAVSEYIQESKMWLRKMAREKLDGGGYFHPRVFRQLLRRAIDFITDKKQVLVWNQDHPDEQINTQFYAENAEYLQAGTDKLKFLEQTNGYSATEEFVENNAAQFLRFGMSTVYLSNGSVEKAESAKDGSSYRIGMLVSIEFSRVIDGLSVKWSEDTEKPESNGASRYHFDWEKLDRLSEMARPNVRAHIEDYIARAKKAEAEQANSR